MSNSDNPKIGANRSETGGERNSYRRDIEGVSDVINDIYLSLH